jgi:hypothetical protein
LRKLLGARYELSLVLIAGSIVLLAAIVIGNNMGNRVLGQVASRVSADATPVPIPTPSAADAGGQVLATRHSVLSVATDPGFPDPRVTPEPPPPATPKPSPKPSPTPTDDTGGDGDPPSPGPTPTYTSPPLAIPLESHSPDESPAPQDGASPQHPSETAAPRPAPRAYPSLPPQGPAGP